MARTKIKFADGLSRCGWVTDDPLYIAYHDHEWGVPHVDDSRMYEFLLLESMQAGLSWLTILKKRENFRRAFAEFNAQRVARFSEKKFEQLMQDAGIIRNAAKIRAAINNARLFLKVQKEFGSFLEYSRLFIKQSARINHWKKLSAVPATTPESDAFARDLKQRGFKFVGSTVIYAHMQAVGLVNDHTVDCFRHAPVSKLMRDL
ncbi:MAG: DNA-3-methyladenine glycosylase I [Leptospiraceae bacterium]|nr:DNA-3-methyladenine glycosylase I [Leptospiraceae bacterium]